MNRGEAWFAGVGRRRRPVLVLTRSAVIEARALVTVAEIAASMRGIAAEVGVEVDDTGLDRPSVVDRDGLHAITKASLTTRVGFVSDRTLGRVCEAVGCALGC